MATTTTVKVGFDGSAVKRGFGTISKGFRGLGKVLGKSLKVGMMAGTAGAITALGVAWKTATGIKTMADYASVLSDMSLQTGIAVSKLVELEEALRTAGVPAKDTSRVMSTLAANMQEAAMKEGAARDALHELGFLASDFKDVKLDDAFMMIGRRIAATGEEVKNLEFAMEGLFGARIGFGLLRLFKDPENFERAAKSVGKLGEAYEENAASLDRLADDLGGLTVQMRGMYLGIYQQLTNVFGENPLQGIFEMFNFDNMAGFFEKVRKTFVYIREEGMGGLFDGIMESLGASMKKLGNLFGEGVKESMGIGGGGGFGEMLKGVFGGGAEKSEKVGGKLDSVSAGIDKTNEILKDMTRGTSTSVFV